MSGDPKRLGTARNLRLTAYERHVLSILLMQGIHDVSREAAEHRQPRLSVMQSLLDRFADEISIEKLSAPREQREDPHADQKDQ